MPTPSRTTLDAIVTAGRAVLEAEGLAGLSMQAVASRVGVRPPSLYKHLGDRADLVRLVAESTVRDLGERMANTRPQDIAALAQTLRTFAHEQPAGYTLVFSPGPGALRPSTEALAAAVSPLLAATEKLAGSRHALDAARTLTAWANGFISMELSDSFALGGDLESAWQYGLARIVETIRTSP